MYRTIDCDTWDDPWFAELPPDAKLLFLYCITNRRATAAGVFEITARAISFETGLTPAAVQNALTALAGKVVWYAEQQTIWVVNFYRRQRANSNGEKFAAGARKALRAFAPEVQRAVGDAYPELSDAAPPPLDPTPIPTPSHYSGYVMPSPWQGDKETEAVTVTVTGSETVTEAVDDDASSPAASASAVKAQTRVTPRPVPKPALTAVPDAWPLTPDLAAWWTKQGTPPGIDPATETEKWQDYHRLKGTTATDWAASWRNWMRKAVEFGQRAPSTATGGNGHGSTNGYRESPNTSRLRAIAEQRAARHAGESADPAGALRLLPRAGPG